jgi:membrane associated rhomboid family serine protease
MNILKYFNYNSYVTLSFFFLSLIVLILHYVTGGWTTKKIFSTERSSLFNPLTYIRFFTHELGHIDYSHFSSNFLKILLLGPIIEEKYGSINFLIMILITAFITGVVNYIIGKSRLCGASNIAFMLIILSSIVNISEGKIPLTLVLIILFYIADEIKDLLLKKNDGISHIGHITGAICGGILGFISLHYDLKELLFSFLSIINL